MSLKKLANETVLYGLTTILGRVLNFLLVPLYVRVFAPEDYAIVTEIFAYVGFLIVIFSYRMETAFFRYARAEDGRTTTVYATATATLTITTVALLALFFTTSQTIANWLEYPKHPEYIWWMALVLGMDAMTAIPFARLRQEGKALQFGVLKLINIAVNTGLNLFFLILCPWAELEGHDWVLEVYHPGIGVGYVFLSNLVASTVTLILLGPQIIKGLKLALTHYDRVLLQQMLRYAGPLIIVSMAGVVNEMLDRAMLKYLLPGELDERQAQLGIYGACYKLAMLMTIFTQAFNYAAEPFFFRNADKEDAPSLYADVAKAFAICGCFVFLGVTLYIDLAKHFLAEDYWSGLPVVPILLLANLFLGLYYNVSVWFKIRDRTDIGMYIALGGALVTILGNYLLVGWLGYIGSAWATLICYIYMVWITWYVGQKHFPVPYNWFRIGMYILFSLALYYLNVLILETFLLEDIFLKILISTGLMGLFAGYVYANEREGLMARF